jgi:hypothetical protein
VREREHATRPPKRISSTRRQTPYTNNFNSKSAARTLLFRRPTYNKIDARAAPSGGGGGYRAQSRSAETISAFRSSNNALDTILALDIRGGNFPAPLCVRKDFLKLFYMRAMLTSVEKVVALKKSFWEDTGK